MSIQDLVPDSRTNSAQLVESDRERLLTNGICETNKIKMRVEPLELKNELNLCTRLTVQIRRSVTLNDTQMSDKIWIGTHHIESEESQVALEWTRAHSRDG